jgi:hypothetical protein
MSATDASGRIRGETTFWCRQLASKHGLAFIGLCALAIAIRSVPAWIYAGWGSDMGIYYGLTTSVINNGALFPAYTGWGQSYEHFPVLYIVTAAPHLLTGSDQFWLMTKVAPVFGGLSAAFVYFIARNTGIGRRTALLAMALLAVNSIHVYQTSHAAPLTMGHFFLLACIYLLTKPSMDRADWALLLVSTFLLVGSHHFTTYLYLASLPAMIVLQRRAPSNAQIAYVAFAAGLAFAYWGLVATEVLAFVKTGTGMPWLAIIPAYAAVVAMAVLLRGRFKRAVDWLAEPISRRHEKMKFWLAFSTLAGTIAILAFVDNPAIALRVTPMLAVYSIPIFAILAFGAVGIGGAASLDRGPEIVGWFLAIALSLSFAVAVGSDILLPERHLEYLMEPMSIFAAVGVAHLVSPSLGKAFSMKTTGRFIAFQSVGRGMLRGGDPTFAADARPSTCGAARSRTDKGVWVEEKGWKVGSRAAIPVLVVALLIGSALASYRMAPEIGFDERISVEDIAAIDWLRHNGTHMFSVATDHRLGTQLEAGGLRATFEGGADLWNATIWLDCRGVLNGTNGTRVGYVLIDAVMRESGVSLAGMALPPVSNETYAMLGAQPFSLVASFANETRGTWAEIYSVNWSHIENATARATRGPEGKLNVGAVQSTPSATEERNAGGLPGDYAAVTQLGECLTEDQVVAGSSPVCGIRFIFLAIHAAGDLNLQNHRT